MVGLNEHHLLNSNWSILIVMLQAYWCLDFIGLHAHDGYDRAVLALYLSVIA